MEIVEKIHDIFLEEAKKSPILMSDLSKYGKIYFRKLHWEIFN